MSPKVKITRYSPKYNAEVKRLIFSILKELGSPPVPQEHRDEDLDDIENVYSGRGNFWVALSNNRVIGTVGIKEKSKDLAKLKRMFVLKEFRSTGLAQELLNKAQNFARKKGYKNMELWTSHAMVRAHSFYKKNGFELIDKNRWGKRYFKKLLKSSVK